MSARNPGKVSHGQLLTKRGLIRKFTQQEWPVEQLESSPHGFGDPNTEITVTDMNSVLVKVFETEDLSTQQLALSPLVYETLLSFNLPAILTGVSIVYNSNEGAGNDLSSGSGYATGDPFNLTIPASARSSGSASIIPDAIPTIVQPVAEDVMATVYEFYVASGTSAAALLALLSTAAGASVLAWPLFNTKLVTLSLHGQTASLAANAEVHKSVYIGDTASSNSAVVEQGYSSENGVSIRTKEISPTLHAAIVLSGPSQTATVAATASAGWTGTGVFPSGSAGSSPTAITLTASVTPTTIPATVPTDIPRTGLYLKRLQSQTDDETGNVYVIATVVDMSLFA